MQANSLHLNLDSFLEEERGGNSKNKINAKQEM